MAEAGFKGASVAPAETPLPARTKLNAEFRAILVGGSIQDFDSFLREEERTNRKLLHDLALKLE
jgi:hypothetical protein